MKNKQMLFTLLAATVLSAGTASAMPIFSSEDPEVQSVWAFFLPYLNGQSEEQKSELQSQLVNLINEQVENFEGDDEDMDEDFEGDFEDYDFATEKPEIIKELTEELEEIDDAELKAELTADLEKIKQIEDEDAFWEAVDAAYDKAEAHYGYEDSDWEDDNFDFATEKSLIIADVNEEIAEIEDQALASELTALSAGLDKIENEDEFFNALDSIYDKVDQHFGYDEDDYEMTECDFGHGHDEDEDEEDDWDDKFENFFDFDDEDEDEDDDEDEQ